MPGGVGDDLATDQSMHPVDQDTAFAAVDRDGDIDRLRAVCAGSRLGLPDGPTAIVVLLPRLRGLVGPDLPGGPALLDRRLFPVGVALREARVAARISPPRGRYPAAVIARSRRANRSFNAPAAISASRKSRRVFASGTRSSGRAGRTASRRGGRGPDTQSARATARAAIAAPASGTSAPGRTVKHSALQDTKKRACRPDGRQALDF